MAYLTPSLALDSAGGVTLTFAETGTEAWIVNRGTGSPDGKLNCYVQINGAPCNFDPVLSASLASTTVTRNYVWGSCVCSYDIQSDNSLRIHGSVNNTESTPINVYDLQFFKLAFPCNTAGAGNPTPYGGSTPISSDFSIPSAGTPGIVAMNISPTTGGPYYFAFIDHGDWQGNMVLSPANWSGCNIHLNAGTPFAAGTNINFDVTLYFTSTSAEIDTIIGTANQAFSIAFPRVCQWNNTRPVGQIYLSQGTGASGYYDNILFPGQGTFTAGDVIYWSNQWYSCTANTTSGAGNPNVNTACWSVAAAGTPLFVATNPWNTNPRGWFGITSYNTGTSAGVTALTSAFMTQAAQMVINIGPKSGSQGMPGGSSGILVWDITGQQYRQGDVEYLGHPSYVGTFAPEMDGTGPGQSGSGHGIADQFFAYFTARGYRVGCCLRATPLNIASQAASASVGGSPYIQGLAYTDNTAAYNDLNNEINFCKNRWGCTIFYVDSNPPNLYPVFQELQLAHPDCLIAPESADYNDLVTWAYDCPYQHGKFVSGVRNGITTPGYTLQVYPQAQCLVDMADCYEPPRSGTTLVNVADLMDAIKAGTICLYRAWWTGGPEYPLCQDAFGRLVAKGWNGWPGQSLGYNNQVMLLLGKKRRFSL